MPKKREFTTKQLLIIKTFDGNMSETARKCGTSRAYVQQLLRRDDVQKALTARNNNAIGSAIMNREQLQAFWTKVLTDSESSMSDRLRASELLGRSNALFTEKVLSGSLDRELEGLSDKELANKIKDNLKLLKTGTDG